MIMAVSDSQRAANVKWDAANMKTVSTRIRVETMEEFRAACERNNKTMHQAIKEFIENYISENK